MFEGIDKICTEIHKANVNAGWWNDTETGEYMGDNIYFQTSKVLLIHAEISEAVEGLRKGMMDDKLPQYPNEAVELADLLIRTFDYCGLKGYPMEEILKAKVNFNAVREDHKVAVRKVSGGKRF